MSIEISRTHGLIAKALDYRAARQDMISSNIANADTPFYKPRDIRFEEVLSKKASEIMKDSSKELKLAQTDGNHLASIDEKSSQKP